MVDLLDLVNIDSFDQEDFDKRAERLFKAVARLPKSSVSLVNERYMKIELSKWVPLIREAKMSVDKAGMIDAWYHNTDLITDFLRDHEIIWSTVWDACFNVLSLVFWNKIAGPLDEKQIEPLLSPFDGIIKITMN